MPALAERTGEVDPGVLAAAQHGDDEAFVDIMRHYDRRLRIVAFHVLNDRQLMDDVLQDVTLGSTARWRAFAASRRSGPGCAGSPIAPVAMR